MEKTTNELKELVRRKYAEIVLQDKEANRSSCCGAGGCSTEAYNIMAEDYSQLEGYNPDADLGLGCGLPTEFARIKSGDTVIDLGSGAGNDCFIARRLTGESGKVIGIDFTPEMIVKARTNAEKLNFNNVEFRQGDIEQMPVAAEVADVVISNCVLNLVPDKGRVFKEIFRVLKPGGHFSISDIVLEGMLPTGLQQAAAMYAGCISGAMQKNSYLELIAGSGFTLMEIQKIKAVHVPDDILTNFLPAGEIAQFRNRPTGIYSMTIYAGKPAAPGKSAQ